MKSSEYSHDRCNCLFSNGHEKEGVDANVFCGVYRADSDAIGSLIGNRAQQFYKRIEWTDMTGKPFIVPMEPPAAGSTWSWDYLGSVGMAFFLVEGDSSKVGGAVFVRRIGNMDIEGDAVGLSLVNGLALAASPSHCLVPVPGGRNGTTAIEQMVAKYMRGQATQGEDIGPRSASGKAALSSKDGMYHVLDLNDMPHRVSGLAVGFERMQQVGGLIREMIPERFKAFCEDLIFDPLAFYERCLQLRDTCMQVDDVNWSLHRMQMLADRPVCTSMDLFSRAMLGKWSPTAADRVSLSDFRRPGAPWGAEASYAGRADLLDAVETWGQFQRAFKGETIANCCMPLLSVETKVFVLPTLPP